MTRLNVADPADREIIKYMLGAARAGAAIRLLDDYDPAEAAEPTYGPKRRRAIVDALADLIMHDLDAGAAS